MKLQLSFAVPALLLGISVPAVGLGADLVVEAAPVVDAAYPGVIHYSLGAAVGLIHNTNGGNGVESNGGADAAATRGSISLDGTLGYEAGSFGVLLGAAGTVYTKPTEGSLDDFTTFHADVTGHAYIAASEMLLVGVFGGIGAHDDNGDSDESMRYGFAGFEAKADFDWGNAFGQVGYLNSSDEYDEGTQKAPFVRIGATYFLDDNFAISAAGSLAGGFKYGDEPNRIVSLEVEPEYKFADSPLSIFARYEFSQISYDDSGDRYGDNFHALKVGIRLRTDGTLRENLSGGGGLSNPMAGQWVAYNANEIE